MRITLLSALALALLQPLAARAQDQFLLNWQATAYSTNSQGKIVAKNFTAKDFIQKVAEDNGLNPATLVFVYRVEKRDTVVARKSDGAFIADVIQLQYTYTDVSNTDASKTVRQSFLNDEYHASALGSAFGTETIKWDKNGNISTYSYKGTFQYSMPDTGTVYSGSFSTGSRVKYPAGE